MKSYSNRDLQQIYRISRMLSNEAVFLRPRRWTPKYRDIWRRWINTKGPDVTIVFE